MAIVYQKSDSIVTSLGFSTEENIHAVLSGKSGLKLYAEKSLGIPEAFFASRIDDVKLNAAFSALTIETTFTRFEKMAILSVANAAKTISVNLSDSRTLFIVSTTKGNVALLEHAQEKNFQKKDLYLWHSAAVISRFFGNTNQPIVVSNACISGVSAQITAKRLLNTGKYEHAVVVGADELSQFIISGFQSFKALSSEACKPFDKDRCGLNLGEGAATIIFGITRDESSLPENTILLETGDITNDANHISGPSRTGEGLYMALKSILRNHETDEIGFINAHGTSTPYNDEMEATALMRAGLDKVPTFSLKGYFGHTLGAAGLLETIIASKSMQLNTIIKNTGYEHCGVTNPINIATQTVTFQSTRCIKMVSGFGGCNAAVLLKKIVKTV
jgi:3-oxoacyl-[acyl-carrier-protein] synthase I